METFCLVLAGRHVGDDAAAIEARLAEAFGMAAADFQARVWQRAPLIVRRGVDAAAARAQADQLRDLGTLAEVLPDGGALVWLSRDGRVLGPLPASARDRFARPGDRWCRDGEDNWHALPAAVSPPPLPARASVPPPLPSAGTRRRSRALPWIAGGAIVLVLAALALHRRPGPERAQAVVRYVPRPLLPMPAARTATADRAACLDAGGRAASGEEDRFLLAGGARQLGGIAQRRGDDYVADAVLARDAQCRPSAVQLYVFHRGGLVGAVLDAPIDPRRVRLGDVGFDAQGRLGYTLRRCDARGDACAAPEAHRVGLRHGDGGWVLARGDADTAGVDVPDRLAPSCPQDVRGQRQRETACT